MKTCNVCYQLKVVNRS